MVVNDQSAVPDLISRLNDEHNLKTYKIEKVVEGKVPYLGRLKPKLREDLMKIKAALSNAGCHSLVEYRREAILELMSFYSQQIVGDTHSIEKRG